MKTQKKRLDLLLVERGLFSSREKAQRSIMAGEVRTADMVFSKPGLQVPEDIEIVVKEPEKYVGRGGLKLEAALDHFKISPAGWVCIDVGASTGGFTDCLLQRGATRVYAVDSGHDQLDWKIRSDSRVVVHEKYNARYAEPDDFPEKMRLAVIDVSFISLTLILPAVFGLLSPDGMVLCLIKPQFESQKHEVGKGGIVRDPIVQERAVARVRDFVVADGRRQWAGVIDSPILGMTGNKEFLACMVP
ncbi:MAG TPA: TlyA family RNA methyltransferase [Chthoniobacterales bacterium]